MKKDAIQLSHHVVPPCKDVREHLLKVVPCLKDHGISESFGRYIFKLVRKGTFVAENYKYVIDATVPCKDNHYERTT